MSATPDCKSRMLYSPASQGAIVGAAIIDNGLLRTAFAEVSVGHFFGGEHQAIFRKQLELYEDQQPFDAKLLAESLRDDPHFEDAVDCAIKIDALTDGVVANEDHARWHAKQVLAYAALRKEYGNAEQFLREADSLIGNPAEIVEKFRERVNTGEEYGPAQPSRHSALVSIAAEELLAKEIKPREMLFDPLIPVQGLGMIYSFRGTGKTLFSFGIAVAIASGGSFLKWDAPRARNVLYVDGELPASTVQQRLAMTRESLNLMPRANSLRIITPDLQQRSMPDLATQEGQRLLDKHLDGVDLLVLDNLSCLCRGGKENEGEGWLPVQGWLLELRRRGMSVLLLHHAGKNLQQRGTSRREDLLDVVMTLKHPSDYVPGEGLRCELSFEKTRSLLSADANSMEIQLKDGKWNYRDLADLKDVQAAEMLGSGMSIRDVAEELGMSKSKVHRIKNRPNVGQQRGTVAGNTVSHGNGYVGQTINAESYSLREV